MMEENEILARFLRSNLNLHPTALQELKRQQAEAASIEELISRVERSGARPAVITPEHLSSLKEAPTPIVVERPRKRTLAEEYPEEVRFLGDKDITKRSFSEGNIEGFVKYFNDRYERLARVLRERNHLRDAITIERAKGSRGSVKVVGIVTDMRKSQKGNTILELEDPTGIIPVVLLSNNQELQKAASEIMKDGVIGVEGNMGREGDILLAKEVFLPDLPVGREPRRCEVPLTVAMLSDLHIGSQHFLEKSFLKFLRWLGGDLGTKRQLELAGRVKYLVIAGDLVEGVGVYPGQEDDLVIKDIFQQYQRAADLLATLPEHVEIVIVPGNHDATRLGEPQPAIPEEFAPALYASDRIHMVGNPSAFELHGVEALVYHGTSLLDVTSTVPGKSMEQPQGAMEVLLRARHLAPTYGGKTQLVPEGLDYLTIDRVPDIFHTGHIHTVGVSKYKGVTLVNSGTFQSETEYQRKQGLRPTPSKVPVLDLSNHNITIMNFLEA